MHWNDQKKCPDHDLPYDYCGESVGTYDVDMKTGETKKVLARCRLPYDHFGPCSYRGISWFPQPTNWMTVSLPWTGPWHGTDEDDVAFGRV